MKTNRMMMGIFVAAMGMILSSPSFGYPPENAAVLYYKSALEFKSDEAKADAIKDFLAGKIELTDETAAYVQSQSQIIKQIRDASNIDFCDWGLDFSEYFDVQLPPMGSIRDIGRIILAKGRIQALQKNYTAALEQCLTVHKMAQHINQGNVLISYLVAGSLTRIANETIQRILGDMPADVETLYWLKMSLEQLPPLAIRESVELEFETLLGEMTRERVERFIADIDDAEFVHMGLVKARVAQSDENFYQRNRNYAQQIRTEDLAAMNLPYSQAYPTLSTLCKKPSQEVQDNPDATLTAIMLPGLDRAYNLGIQFQTFHNAIRAAVEIYLVKAQTGRLPEALPTGMPKDLFSAQDFEYVKTAEGFILRCRGRDLKEDKILEFEFKSK